MAQKNSWPGNFLSHKYMINEIVDISQLWKGGQRGSRLQPGCLGGRLWRHPLYFYLFFFSLSLSYFSFSGTLSLFLGFSFMTLWHLLLAIFPKLQTLFKRICHQNVWLVQDWDNNMLLVTRPFHEGLSQEGLTDLVSPHKNMLLIKVVCEDVFLANHVQFWIKRCSNWNLKVVTTQTLHTTPEVVNRKKNKNDNNKKLDINC